MTAASPSSAAGPAVTEVRAAVRCFLAAHAPDGPVAVACSGGPDSLALAAAAVGCCPCVHGLVVDHQLQPDSDRVAARAAGQLTELGAQSVQVLRADVDGPGGPEAAARAARYAALRAAAPPAAVVLLGHTLDDQAETVLLGLGRGSGPRSIAGMAAHDPPWGRPLLGVSRRATAEACAELGLAPWSDPHNADPRFRRVRLRTEVLPLLEDVLGGGVAPALARTADQLAEDGAVLDGLAAAALETARVIPTGLDAAVLAEHPAALRRRVLRSWLLGDGVPELTDAHLRRADELIGRWRGQGGVALPGGFVVRRVHDRLHVDRPTRSG